VAVVRLRGCPGWAPVGVGSAYPGAPFPFFNPQSVPSPTDYLFDRDQARISAHANAMQQQAAASSVSRGRDDSNAYFNRIRSFSGAETYHVPTRQSLSRRTAPRARHGTRPVALRQEAPPPAAARQDAPAPAAPGQGAPPPAGMSLDSYFLANGALDWPRDAPDSAALHAARAEVEMAVRAVRDEIRSSGRAKAQSIGTAKRKLE